MPLETEEDLEADQEAFFREHLDVRDEPVGSLSFSKPPSATASLLQPVTERRVVRRRRVKRPPAPTSGFPASAAEAESGLRRFGRAIEERASNEGSPDPQEHAGREAGRDWHKPGAGPAGGAASRESEHQRSCGKSAVPGGQVNAGGPGVPDIADMTEEQILEAQQEIAALLSPENTEFLRTRAHRRSIGASASVVEVPASAPDFVNSQSSLQGRRGCMSNSEDFRQPQTADMTSPENGTANGMEETEKTLWMSDADIELPGQKELDQLVAAAVKELGPLAERRFNLNGELLTPDEVESLPTHMGLHHHGAAPTSAGYTLSEVLLLTRSTVVSQRILSLRILAALVNLHGGDIVNALQRSGGLGLAFAAFPSDEPLSSSLTNQIAYVEAVEAFVSTHGPASRDVLIPGLYFASRLYSSALREPSGDMIEDLGKSGCVAALVQIAKATTSLPETVEVALRSLNMVRAIVRCSARASSELLFSSRTAAVLQELASGVEPRSSITALLACDILAQGVVNVAWDDRDAVEKLESNVLSDTFLRNVAVHLSWFLRDDTTQLTREQRQAAKGSLRLLRSGLSFERGILAFSGAAPAICRLLQEDESIATEAYLALEAYAHALYLQANKSSEVNNEDFVKDRLNELIPVALTGSTVFASGSRVASPTLRASAGHFAATILALSTIPLDQSVLVMLFNECSTASKAASERRIANTLALEDVQAYASLSHAGARLLSRAAMDPLYAKREVKCLLGVAQSESQFLTEQCKGELVPWRPVANACAEWIGAVARVDGDGETIELGLCLLPLLQEPQVILDVLSRCLLRVDLLRAMDPTLSIEDAKKCAEELLPVTLVELTRLSNLPAVETPETNTTTRSGDDAHSSSSAVPRGWIPSLSIVTLIGVWLRHRDTADSAVNVSIAFYEGKMIPPVELFRVLLEAPAEVMSSSTRIFDAMFTFAQESRRMGCSLIADGQDTSLSAVSTTLSSKTSDSVIAMADALVARGPYVGERGVDRSDALASIVFTLMWASEVHITLRVALWQKTVEECGGAGLFLNAFNFGEERSKQANGGEDEAFICHVCAAILRGLLLGERCPPVVGFTIVSRIANLLRSSQNCEKSLTSLRDALNSEGRQVVQESLKGMLDAVADRSSAASLVSMWLEL